MPVWRGNGPEDQGHSNPGGNLSRDSAGGSAHLQNTCYANSYVGPLPAWLTCPVGTVSSSTENQLTLWRRKRSSSAVWWRGTVNPHPWGSWAEGKKETALLSIVQMGKSCLLGGLFPPAQYYSSFPAQPQPSRCTWALGSKTSVLQGAISWDIRMRQAASWQPLLLLTTSSDAHEQLRCHYQSGRSSRHLSQVKPQTHSQTSAWGVIQYN